MRLGIWLLLLVTVAAGCGGATAARTHTGGSTADTEGWSRYEDARWGYSVSMPPGWHRAARRLTPALTDPVEIFVAATYPPEPGALDCGPLALTGFDSDQAMVAILERGADAGADWSDFPPRPDRFHYEPGMSSEFTDCLRKSRGVALKDHWFRFTDAGRHFHALVAIGESAYPGAMVDAYRMLDSMRFDPNVKPDWHAAG
jgi:hypothetical protein